MLNYIAHQPDPVMADADRSFYVQLGERIAEQRKARGLNQVQMAERLGVAQQTMAHYEGGTVRIGVQTLALVAQVLEISVEDLLDTPNKRSGGKRGAAVDVREVRRLGMPRIVLGEGHAAGFKRLKTRGTSIVVAATPIL